MPAAANLLFCDVVVMPGGECLSNMLLLMCLSLKQDVSLALPDASLNIGNYIEAYIKPPPFFCFCTSYTNQKFVIYITLHLYFLLPFSQLIQLQETYPSLFQRLMFFLSFICLLLLVKLIGYILWLVLILVLYVQCPFPFFSLPREL